MPARVVPCPTCKREVSWGEESPYRPFCSKRCRMVDLGAWFAEERSIAGQEVLSKPSNDDGDGPG